MLRIFVENLWFMHCRPYWRDYWMREWEKKIKIKAIFPEFICNNLRKNMPKRITIVNVKSATEVGENEDARLQKFEMEGEDEMEASDGYHTFGELYEHRIALFITLCRIIAKGEHFNYGMDEIWRSKLHSDGSSFEGWFILGIGKESGEQISYHLPMSKWEETEFAETLEKAPEFDGHTSADVLERLKHL